MWNWLAGFMVFFSGVLILWTNAESWLVVGVVFIMLGHALGAQHNPKNKE